MWAKFPNELFWGTRKNELSEWKNEKKQRKRSFFYFFSVFFFHFFHSANLVWHESSFQKLAQNESSFFPPRKFWSAGRFTLFDSLLFNFFWQFWKIRKKGTISQTWDFWKTKAAKSTSFENKKVPKYQFLKYQVAYQAAFKMMFKKKEKTKKNELSK